MPQSCLEANKIRRSKRQQWVAECLKQAQRDTYDLAEHIGINPRTWREWVARGEFPTDKEELILEALATTKQSMNGLFFWRTPTAS